MNRTSILALVLAFGTLSPIEVAHAGALSSVMSAAKNAATAGSSKSEGKSAPETVPAAVLTDDKLSSNMVSIMQAKWPEDDIRQAVIVEPEWRVKVNPFGIPEDRKINTALVVRQGKTCAYFDLTFVQVTTDGGITYGPTQYYGVGARHVVACE